MDKSALCRSIISMLLELCCSVANSMEGQIRVCETKLFQLILEPNTQEYYKLTEKYPRSFKIGKNIFDHPKLFGIPTAIPLRHLKYTKRFPYMNTYMRISTYTYIYDNVRVGAHTNYICTYKHT